MKALITGGAGFIGSHLADTLLARGDQVYIIDNLSTGSFENIKHLEHNGNVDFTIDTILNREVMKKLIDQCNVIFHLAAAVGVKYVIDNPLQSLVTNIRGTEVVLELANAEKKKVLLTSTSEVYGKSNHVPYKEDADCVLGPTSISRWGYATSKGVDELLALAYWSEKRLPVTIVRCFNTIGPRQTGQYGMVVPRFVKQALLGHPLQVYGDGSQSRCFAYVSDVIEGMIALMACNKAVGEVFNIGTTEEITIKALAEKIKTLTDSSSPIEFVPYERAYKNGFEDMYRRVPDLTKIYKYVGYTPKVSLDEMLPKIIAYFSS